MPNVTGAGNADGSASVAGVGASLFKGVGNAAGAASVSGAIVRAWVVSLSQNMTTHLASAPVLALTLEEDALIGSVMATAAKYGATLAQAIAAHSALQTFFGKSLTSGFVLGQSPSGQLVTSSAMDEELTVHAALANTMMFNLVTAEKIKLTPTQLLNGIWNGTLSDIIDLSVLYVAPNGSTTTWAINTRTNAITEYQNWAFNSFAQIGRKYIAADANGLYELDGERDLTANINSVIRSGMAQMNATRLSGLKGLYLGMRTDTGGDFFLKLIAGDGQEYVYSFGVQPNQMTTKVEIGRGLRSRYFAFELQGTGADYDLDNLEFVPLLPQRRV